VRSRVIIAVAVLGSAAALWLLRDDSPNDDGRGPSGSAVAELAAPARALRPAMNDRDAAPSDDGDLAPASSSAVPGLDAAALERALAEDNYERVGARFVDYLVARGLPRADGETVVVELANEMARCSFHAFREQAAAQGVEFDTVLDAFAAQLYDADGPLLGAVIDVEAAGARSALCSATALQRAGISEAAAVDLILRRER
jgi:hypothetical protein